MSINFGQFPTPRLPLAAADVIVGYQQVAGVPTLAQYTMLQLAGVLGPLIGTEPPSGPAGGDLSGTYPNPTVSAVHATSGTLNGVTIGATTASTGAFTTLSATGAVSGAGFTALFASPPALGSTAPAAVSSTSGALNGTLGATTPSTVAATTLSASGAVSGAGFTALFASPPSIGNTVPGTGAFTSLTSTSGALNATLGALTRNAANFTTINANNLVTISSTFGIAGTTTNDNAQAGSIGEFVVSSVTAVSLSSGVVANITSISLTAGDWDVAGNISFDAAATTVIQSAQSGINTTTATLPAVPNKTVLAGVTFAANSVLTQTPPIQRISLAGTTTVFLVGTCTFITSTLTADGFIRARRIR